MANSASQDELDRLRAENAELKRRLLALEGNESDEKREEEPITAQRDEVDNGNGGKFEYCPQHSLSPSQISRYSRQVLLQDFGAEGAPRTSILPCGWIVNSE